MGSLTENEQRSELIARRMASLENELEITTKRLEFLQKKLEGVNKGVSGNK